MRLDKVDPIDYKFVKVDADPGFDPEHNKRVISETIKRSEVLWRKKQRDFSENVKERASAISSYAESLKMGQANSDIKKFFGKDYLTYLKGQQILENLKKQAMLNPKGELMSQVKNFYAKTQSKRTA